jgi:acylphosphatase
MNLADGRVEVVASGSDDALDQLAAWLRHGPPSARVDGVEREAIAEQAHTGFSTR